MISVHQQAVMCDAKKQKARPDPAHCTKKQKQKTYPSACRGRRAELKAAPSCAPLVIAFNTQGIEAATIDMIRRRLRQPAVGAIYFTIRQRRRSGFRPVSSPHLQDQGGADVTTNLAQDENHPGTASNALVLQLWSTGVPGQPD